MDGKRARRAIVMGATSGIGAEIVRALAARGWQVGVAGRRADLLEHIMAELPQVTARRQIDITAPEAPLELRALIAEMGDIELYVHSSGVGWQNPELDPKKELTTLETNVVGCARMVDEVFNHFATRRSPARHIAVLGSIAGTRGLGAAPAYSASKRFVGHYLESLTQLCAMRRLRHIHLHDIRPGFVDTAMLNDGHSYPMRLKADRVARTIVRGIERNRSVITIDWRYRLLAALWRRLPRRLWVGLRWVKG